MGMGRGREYANSNAKLIDDDRLDQFDVPDTFEHALAHKNRGKHRIDARRPCLSRYGRLLRSFASQNGSPAPI
jgi:hypothetical protein